MMPTTPPTSAILTEDLAGLRAQALGLAEAAGWVPQIRTLHPGWWRHLPAAWWPAPLHVNPAAVAAPLPDVVVGGGGKAAAVLAALRGPRRVIVQHPRLPIARFDLVVAARHDALTGPNVIVTRTALHRATPARLAEAASIWAPRLSHLPRPLVAVLVGGSNGRFRLGLREADVLTGRLSEMMERDRVGVALTPSRRTDPAVRAHLAARLAPRGAWVWDFVGDNPYFGLLGLADAIVVTADSVSMASEAVATTAPVLLHRLPGRSRRIAAFADALVADGRTRDFAGRYDHWPVVRFDDTAAAAQEMRHRLGL